MMNLGVKRMSDIRRVVKNNTRLAHDITFNDRENVLKVKMYELGVSRYNYSGVEVYYDRAFEIKKVVCFSRKFGYSEFLNPKEELKRKTAPIFKIAYKLSK